MKILIADDEEQIRNGIKNYIQKTGFDFEDIATAQNGYEAMDIFSAYQPDILITDVVMPGMDGILLAKKCRELKENIRIIMISGYEEVDYLKSAFKLKAEDYILKPIDVNELSNSIRSAIVSIENEKSKELERKELLKKIEEHIPLLRERFLTSLILGDFSKTDNLYDRMKIMGISFLGEERVAAVDIYISSIKQAQQTTDDNYSTTYINLKILDIVKDEMANWSNSIVFNKYDNEIIALLCLKDTDSAGAKDLMGKTCQRIITKIRSSIHVGVNIGIGDEIDDVLKVPHSYQHAVEAVNQRFLLGTDQYVFYKDIQVIKDFVFIIPKGIIKEIQNCMYSNDVKSMDGIVDRLFRPLYNSSGIVTEVAQNIRLEFFGFVIDVIKSANITDQHFYSQYLQWNEFMGLETLEEIEYWIRSRVRMACEYFNKATYGKTQNIIERIKQFIADTYDQPINVQHIADRMKLSPNYISALFKHEAGINLTEYLTNYRLDIAMELLKNSSLKIHEICKKCGYEDQNYFTKIFRKRFGVNPSEYRESNK